MTIIENIRPVKNFPELLTSAVVILELNKCSLVIDFIYFLCKKNNPWTTKDRLTDD